MTPKWKRIKKDGITEAVKTYQELDMSVCADIQSCDHMLYAEADGSCLGSTCRETAWTSIQMGGWQLASVLNSWRRSHSAVNTPEAQSGTLLPLLFIIDPVSPERGRSEPYDSAWPAGNRQIMKWYTSMSHVPYSSMSPRAEGADLEELILVAF